VKVADKTLIVISGPTASGKSSLAIDLALALNTEIISADSRQIYKGIPVGTAAPTAEQLEAVRHHMVGVLDLDDYYSAACFESDVLNLLPSIWRKSDYAVLCGGSMMYIDAVTRGIDELPTISEEVRKNTLEIFQSGGIEELRRRLKQLDPEYYEKVDLNNTRRLIHALEIIEESGTTYTSLRTGIVRERPFNIIGLAIDRTREELFDRINSRVRIMMDEGLEDEARSVYHLRHLNSLNTVGYKEMFAWFDGKMTRDEAVSRMAKNTRVYAKKQLTWMKRRQTDFHLLPPENILQQALKLINNEN